MNWFSVVLFSLSYFSFSEALKLNLWRLILGKTIRKLQEIQSYTKTKSSQSQLQQISYHPQKAQEFHLLSNQVIVYTLLAYIHLEWNQRLQSLSDVWKILRLIQVVWVWIEVSKWQSIKYWSYSIADWEMLRKINLAKRKGELYLMFHSLLLILIGSDLVI